MIYLILLLFCLITFCVFIEERLMPYARLLLLVFIGCMMALVAGFRPDDVDHDYLNYVNLYGSSYDVTKELSFVAISYFVYYVFDDVVFLFLIYAVLGVLFQLLAIRKLTELCFLSLLVYLSNYYLLHGMNQIRVAVAAGFFLLSLPCLQNGSRLRFLLYVLCATFFHYTAGVLALLAFFSNQPFKKWQYIFYSSIIPLCYVVYFLNWDFLLALPIPYIEEKLEAYRYLQEQGLWDEINVFNLVFLGKVAITYFLLWKNELIARSNPYVPILLKIEILSLASFVLFYNLPVLAFRLSELLGVVEVILFPLIVYTIKPDYISKGIVCALAMFFLFIGIYYNQVIYV